MPLSPEQQAAIAAAVAANTDAYDEVTKNLTTSLRAILTKMSRRWYDEKFTRTVSKEAAELVHDTAQIVSDLTEQYLNVVLETMDVKTKPANLKVPDKGFRIDADYFDTMFRTARDNRVFRLQGLDEFEAQEKALLIAEDRARMDAALARREAERAKYNVTEDVIGHRRILRPYKSKGGPCGLCIAAATRIYSKGELKPLHNGCVCDSLPITASNDPGLVLNEEDLRALLDSLYDQAGSTSRTDLQRVRVENPEVFEHGELGPILVDKRYRNRNARRAKTLAEQGLDPAEVFKTQDDLVKKYERKIAAGEKDLEGILAFHKKQRDQWAARLSKQQADAA